jgi:hypothetical protein
MTPEEEQANIIKAVEAFQPLAQELGPHSIIFMLNTLSEFAMFLGIVPIYKKMLQDILDKIDDHYEKAKN